MHKCTLSEHLVNLTTSIAYSNIRPIERLRKEGDDTMGGTCFDMIRSFNARMVQDEYKEVRILAANAQDKESVAHAALCTSDHGCEMVEPALFIQEPINLTKLFRDKEPQTVKAYPHSEQIQCCYEIKVNGEKSCTFHKRLLTPSLHNVKTSVDTTSDTGLSFHFEDNQKNGGKLFLSYQMIFMILLRLSNEKWFRV